MSPSTASSSTAPLKRRSKACESCRVRRTRCSGEVPCAACVSNGISATCQIRAKARPSRAACLLTVLAEGLISRALPEKIKKPSYSINSLGTIDVNLAIWCISHPDIPLESLAFRDHDRLELLSAFAPPIPQDKRFEDDLMATFLDRVEFHDLEYADKPQLVALYTRYRALPGSLTEDQLALVYAALCTARALQIQAHPEDCPTEDVTYYAMACEQIRKWNRPSNYACWALFCLTPYVQAYGGASDSRRLLEQMARNIRELGIHRKATATLYGSGDMVDVLLSACAYLDIFTAGLLGLPPALPFNEIDVRPILLETVFPPCMCRAVYLEAQLLEDLANPSIDTTSREYISEREAEWNEQVRLLRLGVRDVPNVRVLWADLRYNWMRILLYAPLFPASCPQIARTISQVLHVYVEVDELGQYTACWPQLRQLSAVAHLLILVSDKGELHKKEATQLWDMLFDFLDRDSHAVEMTAALRRAAIALGIEPRPHQSVVNLVGPIDGQFPFDFDPLSWFTIGEGDT